MFIEINDNRTIREVQADFRDVFPFLKLEFFSHTHGLMEPSCPGDLLDGTRTIGEVRKKHFPGRVEITAEQHTGDLEQHFSTRYDLNVQVYRRYGKTWVQTAGSDRLTLQEQNDLGRADLEQCDHQISGRG